MCSARSFGSASSSASRSLSSIGVVPRRRVPASGRLVTVPPSTRQRISGLDPISVQRRRFQEEHERRRIDDPQSAVDVQRIGLAGHAQALARHKLEDVARTDVFLPRADGVFKLASGEVARVCKRQRRGGINFPQPAGRRLPKPRDDVVDTSAGIVIRLLARVLRVDDRIGDDLNCLVDVVEDHQLVIEPEEDVRQMPVVGGRIEEFFALVIPYSVVAGIADKTSSESRQVRVAVVSAPRKQRLQVCQWIGGRERPGIDSRAGD